MATDATLDVLSPARQKAAHRATSAEEVFGLFYQEGDDAARKALVSGREEREAEVRRAGYRAGGADARRTTTKAPARTRTRTSSATTSTTKRRPSSLAAPSLGGGMSSAQGRSLIILMLALDALGAVANDVISHPDAAASTIPSPPGPNGPQTFPNGKNNPDYIPPPGALGSPQNPIQVSNAMVQPGQIPGATTPDGAPLVLAGYTGKVPVHLRSLAGVLIVGVTALVVNEFSPTFGVLIMFGLTLDVAVQLLHPGSSSSASRIPNPSAGGVYGRLGATLIGAKPAPATGG